MILEEGGLEDEHGDSRACHLEIVNIVLNVIKLEVSYNVVTS